MKESAGSQAARQPPRYLQMVGVHAIRDGWQEEYARPGPIGRFAAAISDRFHLVIIGAIGHVQVVRFRSPKGEDGHFPALPTDEGVVLLRQSPFAHAPVPLSAFSASLRATCGLRAESRRTQRNCQRLATPSAGSLPSRHGPSSFWYAGGTSVLPVSFACQPMTWFDLPRCLLRSSQF